MDRPQICVAITDTDMEKVREAELAADLVEVRIDLIGNGWEEVAVSLSRPWIACARIACDGGQWKESEEKRIETLAKAMDMGADIVDIELNTANVGEIIPRIKEKARCLVSWHNFESTPKIETLKKIIDRQIASGADICKVVTTARQFSDNIALLNLIPAYPSQELVAFAMGELGQISRILCPLAGGAFTYASTGEGSKSAPGQIMAAELREIYGVLGK